MSFVLSKSKDLRVIYEAAKKVYNQEITYDEAIKDLFTRTAAKPPLITMYFDIYAHMRKGECYKRGTSAEFTKYLLEHIYADFGEEAFKKAVSATKLHSEYCASKNNVKPDIEKVCKELIAKKGIALDYDVLPSYRTNYQRIILSDEEKMTLLGAIDKNNSEFSEIIMSLSQKYQIFNSDDLAVLCDKHESRKLFHSQYAYFKMIDSEVDIASQIKSPDGRNRYYSRTYIFNGNQYVMTSQLYGIVGESSHKNNRNPFYEWILEKFDLQFDSNNWWPSKEEYDPGFSKEKWLELLNTPEIFTESALKMIAEFHAYGGTATCAQLASHYKRTYNYYLMTSVHLAERVVKATGCPVVEEERNAQNAKWWPVLYVGKDAEKEEKGSYIWKIREELYDALTEFGIEKYLSRLSNDEGAQNGGEIEMTTKQKIEVIKKYIANKGFTYEDDLIENFYLSLKSKPFVILAGTSGTGKTRLVKLFAEAIGAEMKLIPVRPDWSDSSDLFGHVDLNGSFNPGAIIDFVKEAEENKDKPYFLCLDEMNLARVEYYLSDFLSVIETRDRNEDLEIVTDPLIDVEYYKSEEAKEKYGKLIIPENLYIIGTVNMDETTFPFSKKVLDRANTIEFSFVDLLAKPRETVDPIKPLNLKNDFLKTEYLYLADCSDTEVINSVCGRLQEINEILVKANLHVGYRVRDEIVFYMMNNKKANLLLDDAAFDHEIMQKILPRIQGSSAAIKEVLSQLFIKCAGDYSGLTGMTTFEQMNTYLESKDAGKYPNSAKKIAFMMRRYEEDGFTSYWL